MLIARSSKFPVGKTIGQNTWVHKQYENCLPRETLKKAKAAITPGFNYTVVKFNRKTLAISFMQSVDFDSSAEPLVGDSIKVLSDGTIKSTRASKNNPLLYHHKWLMVKDDYTGFNIQESKDRSARWKEIIGSDKAITSRIGRRNYWLTEVVPKLISEETARSGKTAMSRKDISRPTRILLEKEQIKGSILHHGCGKASLDSEKMRKLASTSKFAEYDPKFAPDRSVLAETYTTIVSNYVMNTLPREARLSAWQDLANSTAGNTFVTIRQDKIKGEPHNDGFLTAKGTYQELIDGELLKKEAESFFEDVEVFYKNSALLILKCRK